MTRAFLVLFAFPFALGLAAAPPSPVVPPEKSKAFEGKVITLADSLKKLGVKADADSSGVVLDTPGGVYTIVKDAKSRLLFMDKELLGREFRLTGRILPGTQMLKVEKVQTIKDGKIFDVDYWCDHCQLEASEPGFCKCCGAEVELRELPAK